MGERGERFARRRARRLLAVADPVHDDVLGVAARLALHDDFEAVADAYSSVVDGDGADRKQAVAFGSKPRSLRVDDDPALRHDGGALRAEPAPQRSEGRAHPG